MSSKTVENFLYKVWGDSEHALYWAQVVDGVWTWFDADQSERVRETVDGLPNDLFFCPSHFDGPRQAIHAKGSRWLFADLDESDPLTWEDFAEIGPTLCWETSPGRWQGMWLMDRMMGRAELEPINQRLTYYVGADSGGWSITKMLRIPGSYSTKRGDPWLVRIDMGRSSKRKYSLAELDAYLPPLAELLVDVADSDIDMGAVPEEFPPLADVMARVAPGLSPQVRQLLSIKTALSDEDRSGKLWEISLRLAEQDVDAADAVVLLSSCAWNKYKGQEREWRRLWTDYHKAVMQVDAKNKSAQKAVDALRDLKASGYGDSAALDQLKASMRKSSLFARTDIEDDGIDEEPLDDEEVLATSTRGPQLTTYRDFLTTAYRKPTWLVEGIWADKAHGLLAGESKTFKTLLILDLAVSIASGTPFLGKFPVPRVGPVIFIQEENDPEDLQDRLMRIGYQRGVTPNVVAHKDPRRTVLDYGPDLPIHLLNNEGFSFMDDEWMKWLAGQVKTIQPALVAFDPLYLLTPGADENSAAEMTPILANLLRLKQRYGCGILIAHHYTKGTPEGKHRRARRMSGTGVFHRWLKSAVYVERASDDEPVVKVSGEQRSHAAGGTYRVEFDLGTEEDLDYEAHVSVWRDEPEDETEAKVLTEAQEHQRDALLEAVAAHVKETGEHPTATELAKAMGLRPATVRRRVESLGLATVDDGINTLVLGEPDSGSDEDPSESVVG
jgi:AAA domain/RepB DNA-primase from phage plasmid